MATTRDKLVKAIEAAETDGFLEYRDTMQEALDCIDRMQDSLADYAELQHEAANCFPTERMVDMGFRILSLSTHKDKALVADIFLAMVSYAPPQIITPDLLAKAIWCAFNDCHTEGELMMPPERWQRVRETARALIAMLKIDAMKETKS